MDIKIEPFLEEISSLSPLTGDYEANLLVIRIYTNLIQKNISNTLLSLNKEENLDFENLSKNIFELNSYIKKIFDESKNYIKNYIVIIKMEKSTNEEISEYKNSLFELNKNKFEVYYNLNVLLGKIIEEIIKLKYKLKEEFLIINDLCIFSLKNIYDFNITVLNDIISNEFEDENEIFNSLNKVKMLPSF